MRDRDLYAKILGLTAPWEVVEVELDRLGGEVRVHVHAKKGVRLPCPECGALSPRKDHRERSWRHLDTCQLRTILVARVPRTNCPDHGVHQVQVPWSEPNSGFTALFEALVIDWLLEASISAVARQMDLTWDEVDGIMQRAVRRGLARRTPQQYARLGVDETSARKGHDYVTAVTAIDEGVVLYVADGNKTTSLDGFYQSLSEAQLDAIEVVAMDMWKPYIASTRNHVPDADLKIAFDKFHVAKHLGDAVDTVRKQEHRRLLEEGDTTLKKTKYLWLKNPDNMTEETWNGVFTRLKEMALKTSRAWAIKEHAMCLWEYVSRGWARKAWKRWIGWAMRSRLEPIKKAARMIREHLEGIINGIVLSTTNAASESINAKIQRVKRKACGFRNHDRFRNAIYFHLGGLDLYPDTHTDS